MALVGTSSIFSNTPDRKRYLRQRIGDRSAIGLEVHAADTYAPALMEPVLAAAAGRL
jgi:hypothetical protein